MFSRDGNHGSVEGVTTWISICAVQDHCQQSVLRSDSLLTLLVLDGLVTL